MDSWARRIFRDALATHYVHGIAAGDEVHLWLRTHGGWLPDPQEVYGDGTPDTQPADEGDYVDSRDPDQATEDAMPIMLRLSKTLDEEEDFYLLDQVNNWLDHEEAPCNARDRSRSPRRPVVVEAATDRIDILKGTIKGTIRALTAAMESQIETLRLLKLQVAAKDARISDLELELARSSSPPLLQKP